MLVCAYNVQFGTRDRGCQSAPGFPCALCLERANEFAKLGRNMPRDREVMADIVSRARRSMERLRNDALQTRDPGWAGNLRQEWVPAQGRDTRDCPRRLSLTPQRPAHPPPAPPTPSPPS